MQDATLVFLLKGNPVFEVLLGFKKIGFGQGKYTGFGGKIKRGEEVAEAALRELNEETGVTVPGPETLEFSAILEFRFPCKPSWSQDVHVYTTHHWQGIPTESNEMIPQWFPLEAIPYNQMWDDAPYWLPKVISGERFQAHFDFKGDNATVKNVKFKPLSKIKTGEKD